MSVSADGERVVFLRSRGGSDPVNCLWVRDLPTGEERIVADPLTLLAGDDAEPTAAERARRERAREGAEGVTSYATDAAGTVVSFALAGQLFVAGLLSGHARPLAVEGPVFDPRPDPPAQRVAYVSGRRLCLAELDGTSRVLVGDDEDEHVSWGSADFLAAEEMQRFRGYWWNPAGTAIAACRVDVSPVAEWMITDPASPHEPARPIRYPAAGTPNPVVTLHLLGLGGSRVAVDWDREFFPYLVDVDWSERGLLMAVQARDQQGTMVLRIDERNGETEVLGHDYDDAWVDIVGGTPRLTESGALVTCADRDGARRLMLDGEPATPPDLVVRSVIAVDEQGITFQANPIDDATVLHVWRRTAEGELQALTDLPGTHNAVVGGRTTVIRSTSLDRPGITTSIEGTLLDSFAETPLVRPNVELIRAGEHDLATAVLLPRDHDGGKLPVLLDPYGGPHALRVTRAYNSFTTSQWFADQGFAVVVADGRGTPGRGSEWERAVRLDLATAPLDDQVAALEAAAERYDELDLDRVAIRGWSFGGYLAALAVLRRPDVFHAAVAGAPVTEWRLYDTHYTERYLGDPAKRADVYDASSLLPLAADLTRPLLLIHGLADDNVVAAHTLQLSSALLAAGRPHEVLPLVGVTHMTPQEVVAENLLHHQLDFIRRSLRLTDPRERP